MINEKIALVHEQLKESDINGFITGSSMIKDCDFDLWDSAPDVDVFVPNNMEMIHAIDYCMFKLGFILGSDNTELSHLQESKKLEWVYENKKNKNGFANLHTVKLWRDGIIVNISTKYGQKNLASVLSDFDMTIIMRGYDIKSGAYLDLTEQWSDRYTAKPNPLRAVSTDTFTTAYWVRQFDRVMKYYDRGFDTTPMARFYIDQIDNCLNQGNIWSSDASKELFNDFKEQFTEMRERIVTWLENKEEE